MIWLHSLSEILDFKEEKSERNDDWKILFLVRFLINKLYTEITSIFFILKDDED